MADMLVYGTLGTTEYSLINLVRGFPELYNPQDPGHHDSVRIDATWAEIGRQLNKEKEWCFSKWASLLDDYKKRKAVYDSMGASVTMMSWLQYDALSFLDLYQNNQQQPQRDNASSISQNPVVHAAPPEPCYSNGTPGHQPQQLPHPPPPQPHQQMIIGGIEGMAQQTDTFLQFRTIYKCPTCLKTFSTDDKLREHVRTKQCLKFDQNNLAGGNVQDNISTNDHTSPGKKKKLDPQQQMEKYADENMRMLQSHASSTTTTNFSDLEQTDHSSSGGGGSGSRKGGKNSTRVTCSGCGRSFQGKNSKYALKKHYQSHYHDGPSSWGFTCDICGKKCQFQFKLQEHTRTHTKETPFECEICGRKFSIKFNLKRHIKLIHSKNNSHLKSQNMKNA